MKSTTIVSLALLTSLILPSQVMAQDAISPTVTSKPGFFGKFMQNRQEFRGEIRENREEVRDLKKDIKQDIKDKKVELKGTITQDKNDFRRRFMVTNQTGLYKSFTIRSANLERYQKLIGERITTKLAKLPGNQGLVDAQKRLSSDELKNLWSTYSSDLAKYDTTIKSLATATDVKSILPQLKTEAKKVNEDIKSIRKFLVETLRLVVKAR